MTSYQMQLRKKRQSLLSNPPTPSSHNLEAVPFSTSQPKISKQEKMGFCALMMAAKQSQSRTNGMIGRNKAKQNRRVKRSLVTKQRQTDLVSQIILLVMIMQFPHTSFRYADQSQRNRTKMKKKKGSNPPSGTPVVVGSSSNMVLPASRAVELCLTST